MNPRLQVEHGVSELLTGRDIVELQLQSAAGLPFDLRQSDIRPNGHAIEARVYPEDPDTCLPNVGVVTEVHLPQGENVRVDTALYVGYEVSLHLRTVACQGDGLGPGSNRRDRHAGFRPGGLSSGWCVHQHSPAAGCAGQPGVRLRRIQYRLPCQPYSNDGCKIQKAKSNGRRDMTNSTHPAKSGGSSPVMDPRALAAAIGAAAVYAAQGQTGASAADPGSRWRTQGRRELFRSRLGSGSW